MKKETVIAIAAFVCSLLFFFNREPILLNTDLDEKAGADTQIDRSVENLNENPTTSALDVVNYEKLMSSPPEYLKGTDLRGGFPVDENGNLIIHRSIKNRFDYFFLMTSDLSIEEIMSIIKGNIFSELEGDAQITALELLNSYRDYLDQYQALLADHEASSNQSLSPEQLQLLLSDISALRFGIFGEEVARVFFDEENWLQRQSVSTNSIEMLDSVNYIVEGQAETLSYTVSKNKEAKFLKQKPSDKALFDYRVEEYGEDAAVRLTKLDADRRDFENLLETVRELSTSSAYRGLSNNERRESIQDYLATELNVSENIIKRLMIVSNI